MSTLEQQRICGAVSAADTRVRLLLAEHIVSDAQLVQEMVKSQQEPIELTWLPRLDGALELLGNEHFDALLLDLSLPDSKGLDAIRRVHDRTDIPIIVLASLAVTKPSGVEALLAGAADYLLKEHLNSHDLVRAVQFAIARHRTTGQLRALSFRDELTGLYNRRAFMTLGEQQLKIARRENSGLALAFVDLDDLKSINDRFGHKFGDFALTDSAKILKNTFRESDIIARIGGDEFAILWMAPAAPSPAVLRTRLQAGIESHRLSEPRLYQLSMSIGVSHYESGFTESLSNMLFESDRQMYADKRTRRSPVR
jgi:two-component system cell cycle response regulator